MTKGILSHTSKNSQMQESKKHEFTIKIYERYKDQGNMSKSQPKQQTTESDSQSYGFVKMSLIHKKIKEDIKKIWQ